MFKDSAKKYYNWTCSVGGGSATVMGKIYGMGCVLDELHTITAHHCWTSISHKYEWPVVLREDGLFLCEIVFNSTSHDIIIYKSIKKLSDKPKGLISEYPNISEEHLFLGESVGFMSRLTTYVSYDKSTSHTHFSSGTISMFQKNEEQTAMQFVISSTVIQKGFSGSAVFTPDGSLVGILVQTLRFAADIEDPESEIYTLPVMAPIRPLINEINNAITV